MTVLLAIGLMILVAGLLALRVIFGKDEEVRRPGCANANLFMEQQDTCPVCGADAGAACETSETGQTDNAALRR